MSSATNLDRATAIQSAVGVLGVVIVGGGLWALLQTPFPLNLIIGGAALSFVVGIASLPLLDSLLRHAGGGPRAKLWWIVGALNYGATVCIEHPRGYDLVPATILPDGTWRYEWDGETYEADGPTYRLGLRPFAITYIKTEETMGDLVRETEVDDQRGGHETVRALADMGDGAAAQPRLEADGGAHVTPIRELCEGYAVDLINVWHTMRRTGGLSVVERAKEAALRDASGDKELSQFQWALLAIVCYIVSAVLTYWFMVSG